MKKKLFILAFTASIFTITTSAIMSSKISDSRNPTGRWDATGNPANIGVGNCSGCHSGTVNNGGTLAIVVKDSKGKAISGYAFNETYTVEVTITRSGISTFGFDAEIVTAANKDAGKITAGPESHTVTGDRSTNVTHSTPAKTSGSHTFTFTWKSPAADSGVVTIYAAGLAANGNGKNTGDYTYTNTKKLNALSKITEYDKTIDGITIYPNPISSLFHVSYNLKKSSNVSINLYSISGQKIISLLNNQQREGLQNQVITLPSFISSGSYLLQISTDGNEILEKISVNK